MKLLTLLQAGALLLLAMFGAYASANHSDVAGEECATTTDLSERCDL